MMMVRSRTTTPAPLLLMVMLLAIRMGVELQSHHSLWEEWVGDGRMDDAPVVVVNAATNTTTTAVPLSLKIENETAVVEPAWRKHDSSTTMGFQETMRQAFRQRVLPYSCRAMNASSNLDPQRFHRGGDIHLHLSWFGSNLSHVENSCSFVTKSFSTPNVIQNYLDRPVHWSVFQKASQCDVLSWDRQKALNWEHHRFKSIMFGILGHANRSDCREQSVGGRYRQALLQNLTDSTWTMETIGNRSLVQEATLAIAKGINKCKFPSEEGYCGTIVREWTTECARKVLNMVQSMPSDATMNLSSLQQYIPTTTRPPVLQVTPTTLGNVTLPMIQSMEASSHGILPPAPYLVYSTDAVVSRAVHTSTEMYFPGGSQHWMQVADAQARSRVFVLHKDSHFRFANLTHEQVKGEIFKVCAEGNAEICPYPIYNKVISLYQKKCNSYFHFMVEVWPRIAPWLDEIVADDTIMLHLGADVPFQKNFYELLGIHASRILTGDIFAKEVYIPTVGYAHGVYLNFWNLVAMREQVEKRIGIPDPIAQSAHGRNILIFVRDEGRRVDKDRFSDKFFDEMKHHYPHDNIVQFTASNTTLMTCLKCQIQAVQNADVIIGSHGAGLSHLMWAKHDATVLEVLTGRGDSSVFAEMAFMFGLKYFPMSKQADSSDFAAVIEFG